MARHTRRDSNGRFLAADAPDEYTDRPDCGRCAGTGEGMTDGSRCPSCRGRGYLPSPADRDAAEYWADRKYDQMRDDIMTGDM
jgi:RecJ-like exonuclease